LDSIGWKIVREQTEPWHGEKGKNALTPKEGVQGRVMATAVAYDTGGGQPNRPPNGDMVQKIDP